MSFFSRLIASLLLLATFAQTAEAEEQRQVFVLEDGRELYGYVVEQNDRKTVLMTEIRGEDGELIRGRMSVDTDAITSATDTEEPPPALGERISQPAGTEKPRDPIADMDDRELERLRQQRAQQEDRIQRAHENVREAEQKLADLEARMQRLNEGFVAAQAMHEDLNAELEAARDALREARAQADRDAQRGGTGGGAWQEIETAQDNIKRLRESIDAVEDEVRRARAEVENVRARHRRLSGDLKMMRTRVKQLEEKLEKMPVPPQRDHGTDLLSPGDDGDDGEEQAEGAGQEP